VGFADAAAVNEAESGVSPTYTLVFFQERFMLNEVGVKIKLIRSRDTFCLIGAASRVRIILDSEIGRVDRLTSGSFDDGVESSRLAS